MIGNILLSLALAAGVFSVIMYFLTYKGYQNTLPLARIGFHAAAIMVMAASALLLHAILTHQYEYKYIYNYSGSDLPTGLLMSTFYAGQEGSFMLWTLFSAIIGLILLEYTSKRGDLEPRVMMVFALALSFLIMMVNPLLKSPFNFIWTDPEFVDLKNINPAFLSLPALQNYIFSDPQSNKQFVQVSRDLYSALLANNISMNEFIIQGKGLNPLLQNFWMQIHPPILFVGFAMSAVPFSFALAALIKNEYKDWVKQSLPWVLTGTMVLGVAIMLGGYWAYGVLGWGGYWGWDPVENSSLIPWIVGVASIHTMLVQKKTQDKDGSNSAGRFVKTNLILSILIFVLVIYSTFLTRSGILGDASVHSFVDPGMIVYFFLVLFLGIFYYLGIGSIVSRFFTIDKKYFLIAFIVLMTHTILILFLPSLYEALLTIRELWVVVSIITVIALFYFHLCLLKILTYPLRRWFYGDDTYKDNIEEGKESDTLSRELALFTGAVALIASAIIVWVGTSAPIFGQTVELKFYNELNLPIAIIIGLLNGFSLLLKWKTTDKKDLWKQSQFSVIASIVLTVAVVVFGGVYDLMLIFLTLSSAFALFVNGEIAFKILKGRKSHLGAYIAHIGIALFFIGVLATAGHSQEKQVDLVKGEKVNVLGHDLTFTGYEPFDNGKKYHFNIEVTDGGSTRIIKPVMFVAEFNNSLMREPDILIGLTKDFYVAPVSYDEGAHSNEGSTAALKQGASFNYQGKEIIFNKFVMPKDMSAMMSGGSFRIGADITVKLEGKEFKAEPAMESAGQGPVYTPVEILEANLRINIVNMNASNSEVVLAFSNIEGSANAESVAPKEILTVDASTKPFISLVWIGVITMAVGFIVSAFRRSKESLA